MNQKDIQQYMIQKRELQASLLNFIDNGKESNFVMLLNIIESQRIIENEKEFRQFLRLLAKICENHHRNSNFLLNFQKILLHFENQIKQTFSNSVLFDIFKKNKLILDLFFNKKIINIDSYIYNNLLYESKNDTDYYFFIKELKSNFDEKKLKEIENKLLEDDPSIFDNFDQKRLKGENDSYLCSLIRNDSVEEFVSFISRTNLSLSSKITFSIFETNLFLLKNVETSLIEYAAFFGSIQIFQFLRLNNVELTPSLWLYTIHGRNAELIHLLEEDGVPPPNGSYESCLKESIKCHHNEIAEYIENNLLNEKEKENNIKNNIDENEFAYSFHYYNYAYMPDNYETVEKDNYDILKLLLEQKGIEVVKNCFQSCSKLTEFTITSNVVCIGENAFNGCYSLQKIDFNDPSIIPSIGSSAFKGCIKLQSISIPSSVTSIGKKSFEGCCSLKEILFNTSSSSLKLIDSCAFKGCSSLTKLDLPLSLTVIKNGAFSKCSSLVQILMPPEITTIESQVFESCLSLKKIELPSKIKDINEGCFAQCSELTSVVIHSSVTKICHSAFKGCRKLKEVSFPLEKLRIIDSYAFSNCSSLDNISFENCISLNCIGFMAFEKCESLKELIIPSSVSKIDQYAFIGCSSLVKISFASPSSLTSIRSSVFMKCTSLKQVLIPSSVKSIESSAFQGCSSLNLVVIPSSVIKIGINSFYECSSLTEISIPSSVIEIGSNAFNKCSSMMQISVNSLIDISKIGLDQKVKVIFI